MQLQLATWIEVETYLAGASTILMPIGSTEQHGPNGLMGTDSLSSEAITHRAGEISGVMVGPTIHVGTAAHHMAFCGSMTLRPSTLIAVIRDYVRSLAHHGFRRFIFLNGHGGNSATLRTAFAEIYDEGMGGTRPAVDLQLVNWWELPSIPPLSRELFGNADGSHATASEVSVLQYLYPDHIKKADLEPPVAPTGTFTDAVDYRRRFPDGRIGSNPGLATPRAGLRLLETAATDLAAIAAAKEQAPRGAPTFT